MTAPAHCGECALGATAARAVDPPAPGDLVDGRYRVDRVLGRGGMGLVLLATDVHLRREVALKVPAPDPSGRYELFLAEVAALAAIRHPNVVGVHAFGVHEGMPFFTMEYVHGASLDVALRDYGGHRARIPRSRVIAIVNAVARGLEHVHARGLVHRDVKPSNIVIERGTGRPVLVDFGVCAVGKTAEPRLAGTPGYMAPELWMRAGSASAQSDQYALAVTAYELFTGRGPFSDEEPGATAVAHLYAPPAPMSTHFEDLAALDGALLRGLAKEPQQRYRSCVALAESLELAAPPAHPAPAALDPAEGNEPGALRILVVDDDPDFQRIAVRCAQVAFADQRVEVARARNGWQAIESAARCMPRLLLLDYRLPEVDGVEVLSRLRAMPHGEDVEVVVTSGSVGATERWRFSILGVRHFADKPLGFVGLAETIIRAGQSRGWIGGTSGAEPTRALRP